MVTNYRVEAIQILVAPEISVSGHIGIPAWWPSGHRVGIVLGHDAGSNMDQPFLSTLHLRLVQRGYLPLRFNFPFAEQRKKRPDPTPCWRERSEPRSRACCEIPRSPPRGSSSEAWASARALPHRS